MDDWEDLLKISTKNNSDSTKWTILGVEEVAACLIHHFGSISVLHHDLIPDDKPRGSDKIGEVPLFLLNVAVLVTVGIFLVVYSSIDPINTA